MFDTQIDQQKQWQNAKLAQREW